jgi:hypothetical protein
MEGQLINDHFGRIFKAATVIMENYVKRHTTAGLQNET